MDEYEAPIVSLEDDLGNEVEFEVLDVVNYENEEYAVLLPTDEDANEVVILLIDYQDDEEVYIGLDDDDLIDAVFAKFKEQHPDEWDYE